MHGIIYLVAMITMSAAYIQHLVTTWANDQLFLFLLGLFLFPIGVVHGLLVWLGVAG